MRGKEPKDEVQIYTWMDATLRELTDLVQEYLTFFILREGIIPSHVLLLTTIVF